MAGDRSFKDYVAKKFDNNFWAVAEAYLENNREAIEGKFYRLHKVGEIEIADVVTEWVWIYDCPDMKIQFDVAVSMDLQAAEGDYHYDNYEERKIKLMLRCKGDLACALEDFEIFEVKEFDGRNLSKNLLDDSLVPYISKEQMEDVAKDFLKRNYPEALKITPHGQEPVWVDPIVLAERLGLSVRQQTIKKDASVFGQIYFEETEAELYDKNVDEDVKVRVPGKTILVDPAMFLLRNLGSINNTIVHECVHWDKHRKAFYLEKMFNESASCISCEVVGGASAGIAKKTTEFMEYQANQLAPRIQMPADPFKAKANEYISKYLKETGAPHTVDVMEMVIEQLAISFCVSRQAAKIRMVQLGFEDAIGTFTYVDGHYVRPHGFKNGSLQLNQTFTISAHEAALERFVNQELREKTQNGDYLFLENHYVYNAPLYVQSGYNGRLELTDYARAHMDECCLVFDLSIKDKVAADYHTVCFLNREPSDITFEVKYHNGYQNAPQERQVAMRKKQVEEWMAIRKQMTDDPEQCMRLLLEWKGKKYTELADAIDINEKTIRRMVNGETTPKFETVVLICFGLNLPPTISEKLLSVFGCKIKLSDLNHQWIYEALHIKYPEPVDAVREYLEAYGVVL